MRRDLFAQLTAGRDDYSLGQLARAIACARRHDQVPVWRAFVRSRGVKIVSEQRTQKLRHVAA